jgi:O-antigen/teichoic acid export membrane protein
VIFGQDFAPAATLLQLVTPFYLATVVAVMSYYLLIAVNQHTFILRLMLGAILATLGLGTWMMWSFGLHGAGLTLVIIGTVIMALYWRQAARAGAHLIRSQHDAAQWLAFGGTLALGAVVHAHAQLNTWYHLVLAFTAASAAYALFLWTMRGYLPQEKQLLAVVRRRLWARE